MLFRIQRCNGFAIVPQAFPAAISDPVLRQKYVNR